MNIHTNFAQLHEINNPVVTTGSFDGVHIGHKTILNRINSLARQQGGESVLITFYPHPRRVLFPHTRGKDLMMINTQREKAYLLEQTGLDHLIVIPFTREFAQISSFDFVKNMLVKKLHATTVVVGFNHHFGHNREGNYQYLYRMGKKHGYIVEEIPEQDLQNESVSSTRIRKSLHQGDIQRANAYLDHLYFIMGQIGPGNRQLDGLGFPTLMISLEEATKLIPPDGVYAIRLEADNKTYKGMLNISKKGASHSGLNENAFVEVYLFEDVPQSIYGRLGRVNFYKRMRDFQIFDNPDSLRKQLLKDKKEVEELIY
ncbi:MAG TPA: riboflavin biosynthesis protein RibF [Bacteroidales bacterium]|nr:riboflavin biosynthesis protein RibF [Bacteroidales bacterium]